MPDQFGDKQHEATPHRRQQAREQGQVAKSQDLASAVLLLGSVVGLMFLGGELVAMLFGYAQRQLGSSPWLTADVPRVMELWSFTWQALARTMLPILGLLVLLGVLINLGQTGFVFVPSKLAPDVSRINPLKGLGRIFSLPGLMRLTFGLFKVLIVAAVVYVSLYDKRDELLMLAELSCLEITVYLFDILLWTALKVAVALVLLALLDYAFQKWKHEQDLRMTTQEMKEEMKTLQGDPQVIARRRQVQRQLAMNRMEESVPKADFVVTNPTELAVAVQYDMETMAAPIVVAKGAGVIAKRIRRLALENGIPVIERKPLARALFKEVEVNHAIPQQFYSTVAELLRYVYDLKGKKLPGAA